MSEMGMCVKVDAAGRKARCWRGASGLTERLGLPFSFFKHFFGWVGLEAAHGSSIFL